MANEAVIVNLGPNGGNPIKFTVADDTNISKGALLGLVDPRTASGGVTLANSTPFAGIAAADKEANDGSTKLSAYTEGIFDLTCGPAVSPAGLLVSISLGNLVKPATEAEVVTGDVIGKTYETGTAAEKIQVMVGQI
jgi:hypothetical protein